MPFRTHDHAPFLGRIEARIERVRALPLARAVVHGVIDFVPETERRRLRAAAGRAQRTVRIPMNHARVRIEVVGIVPVSRQRNVLGTLFEAIKKRTFLGVAPQIRDGRVEVMT